LKGLIVSSMSIRDRAGNVPPPVSNIVVFGDEKNILPVAPRAWASLGPGTSRRALRTSGDAPRFARLI
jgi:hypothetical protein